MSKVLVTGGAGYIGSAAVAILLDAGYEVSVLDDCSTGHPDAVDPRASFTHGSILETDAIRKAIAGCESVMHFAGKSLVGESVEKPEFYMEVNVQGSTNLLDVMREVGISRIVFSSSAATYGEPTRDRITEDSPTNPTNPYGVSKLAVDQLLSQRANEAGIAAISLRYFNVAGAHKSSSGWLAERHNPETHLIPNVLHATEENPLKIFGTDWPTHDQTCIRDYVHIVDLIDAHMKALNILKSASHQIINLGSGDGYSVREVINAATAVLGREIPAIETKRRAGDPAVLVASITKAKDLLDWMPLRDMKEMISDAYASKQ